MRILGLYWSFGSGASLFDDNRIVAAVSEERFTRAKNEAAFPLRSIEWIIKKYGISPDELDGIAFTSNDVGVDYNVLGRHAWDVDDYVREQREYWYPLFYGNGTSRDLIFDIFKDKIILDQYPYAYWREKFEKKDFSTFLQDKKQLLSDYFGVPVEKVHKIEHHRSHAVYSYYASHFRGEDVLAFTIDGWGDGMNATIGIFDEKGNYKRVMSTQNCNIARIYRYMTLLLGMKPSEHEYKVMGLAPYGKETHARRALELFRSTLYVDGIDFKWHQKPSDSYYWFRERLEGVRFDNIAWALQTWTEELLTEWVGNAIRKYNIRKIVFSGGVAMNVKAIGKIASLPEVEDIFVGGTACDDSHAIAASYCLAEDLMKQRGADWDSSDMAGLPHLFLGPHATLEEEQKVVADLDRRRYDVRGAISPRETARYLADGKILARCAGRMEFGQRALGNRSILADPINFALKNKINAAVKSRDFWMPFAPIVMDKYNNRYLQNPKKIESPHMAVAFETTSEGFSSMPAACHPSDQTARAQILHKEANPQVYEVLEEFEAITGRGALLNTSFNLHGQPIVNTPAEALDVMKQSELDGLILNNFFIIKKTNGQDKAR